MRSVDQESFHALRELGAYAKNVAALIDNQTAFEVLIVNGDAAVIADVFMGGVFAVLGCRVWSVVAFDLFSVVVGLVMKIKTSVILIV